MDNGERKGSRREENGEGNEEEEEEEEIEWLCSLSRAVTNRARAPGALEEVAIVLATIARRYGGRMQQPGQQRWQQQIPSSLLPELSGPEACLWHAPDGAMWGTGAREVARVISVAAEKCAQQQLEIATLGCWRMWTLGVLFDDDKGQEEGGRRLPAAAAAAPLVFVILPGSQRYIRSALDRVIERVWREEEADKEKEQRRQPARAFLCRTCYDSASLLGRRGRAAATKAFLAMRFLDYERAVAADLAGLADLSVPLSFFGEVTAK